MFESAWGRCFDRLWTDALTGFSLQDQVDVSTGFDYMSW